jgi:hypothetical protein
MIILFVIKKFKLSFIATFIHPNFLSCVITNLVVNLVASGLAI